MSLTLFVLGLNGRIIAQLDAGGQGELFEDPCGGSFTPAEQAQFRRVAQGLTSIVTLHEGTKHETPVHVRLACAYGEGAEGVRREVQARSSTHEACLDDVALLGRAKTGS